MSELGYAVVEEAPRTADAAGQGEGAGMEIGMPMGFEEERASA